MSNSPSWDEIFRSQPGAPGAEPSASGDRPAVLQGDDAPLTRRELREAEERAHAKQGRGGSQRPGSKRSGSGEPPKRKRRLTWLWVLLSVIVVGAVGAGAVWHFYEPQVRKVLGWELPVDYTGTGNGTPATVVIKSGDIGEDVARSLHTAGVTMTFDAFYQLLLKTSPAPSFVPGTYSLQKHMSAASALAALKDPKNHITAKVVIPEGTTIKKFLQKLADGTGLDVADYEAAIADPTVYGIPADAPSMEGYLFPATYTFDPGMTAQEVLTEVTQRMFTSLNAAGVAPADYNRVLTLASIIQKEGGSTEDFYKVSRVFTNRIEQGMLLQSDATVSYGSGGTSISTTGKERADASNPYNTYVHPGLPIGPIAAPGDAAIDAALHPADGPWLYFVLINGETGETAFSSTLAEHNKAVKVWQAWLRDHPDFDN